MKTFLKIILGILAILVIAMLVIGKKYHYEKSILIKAPVEEVYAHASSMKAFNQWNPWMKLDPNLRLEYSGKSGKVGDKYCWKGNKEVGKGCHEITALFPNRKVATRMVFVEPFESDATSDILLTSEENSTRVIWNMDCELDYPMNLMGFFMTEEMDKSYGGGLNSLKDICEK